MTFKQDTHCSYCGTKFAEQIGYPRKCFKCYNDTWLNPLPCVISAIKVWDPNPHGYKARWGVLLGKRHIEPQKGKWSLIGGYLGGFENWKDAGVREIQEEVGITVDPNQLSLYDVISNDTNHLIIRSIVIPIFHPAQIKFVPNDEVSEIMVAYEPQELAFVSHTELLKKVLSKDI